MHSNGQRPGAVTNMTTEELDKALQSEPVVECVKEHKTATTGTARLIIQDNLVPFLKIYATTIRPSFGSHCPLAFPNQRENPIDHFSRAVINLAKQFGINGMPRSTDARHSYPSAAATKSDNEKSSMAVTMSHSKQTQARYYTHNKSTVEAVKGFKVLQNIRQEAETERQSRKKHTKDEMDFITTYFKDNIDNQSQSSIDECREFVKQHSITRSGKQIWDKLKYLTGHR